MLRSATKTLPIYKRELQEFLTDVPVSHFFEDLRRFGDHLDLNVFSRLTELLCVRGVASRDKVHVPDTSVRKSNFPTYQNQEKMYEITFTECEARRQENYFKKTDFEFNRRETNRLYVVIIK